MKLFEIEDCFGNRIRLTAERWNHTLKHKIPRIDRDSMETEQVKYDSEADILYLWSKDPATVDNIVSKKTGNEILIEKDADTGETIGITILHVSKRNDMAEGLQLSTAQAA